MSEKLRLETDPYNRVIFKKTGKKSDLQRYRQVLDGRFKVDKNNELTYQVKAPLTREDVPHQLKLKGKWALTEEHDLRFTLDKLGRDTLADKITIKGEILDVRDNSLLFAVSTKTQEGKALTYVLQIGGVWRADSKNRLTFHIKKEKGIHDVLTFKGAWEINKDHQIVYNYTKARLIRKKKELHKLTFKGGWKVAGAGRISYEMKRGSDSSFDFRTSAGIVDKNRIMFEVGIGVSDRVRPVRRRLEIFGKWRLVKNVGLVFEAGYKDGKPCSLVFGADAELTGRDSVRFRLKRDIDNRDTDMEIELSRRLLKGDGEAFLRLLSSRQEATIYAGAAWKW